MTWPPFVPSASALHGSSGPSRPPDREIAAWVVATCLLWGTTTKTAHQIAVYFLEALEPQE